MKKHQRTTAFAILKTVILTTLVCTLLSLCACFDEPNLDNISELFAVLADAADFEISDKAQSFLKENDRLFPAKNLLAPVEYSNYNLEYKQVIKNPDAYGDELMVVGELYVTVVYEEEMTDSTTLTEIQAYDEYADAIYYIFYPSSLEVYEGDCISAFLLPLGSYSFDNVGGGTTISLACAGAYIEVE